MATRGRTQARGRRARPAPRRKARARRASTAVRRRRLLAGVIVVGLGALVVSQLGVIGDAIREVTLPLRHDDIIRQQASEKGVDADLIAAVIYEESKFRDETSAAGARGLMQITPQTARAIEDLSQGQTFVISDLANPDINIRYGTFYLAYLLDLYDGNEVAALAAYNAGPSHADEWGGSSMGLGDIEFPETREYVSGVLETRRDYREHYADELGL